jgi:tetratricopeptide (TPR) repeat protein
VNEIEKFSERVGLNSLAQDQREKVVVTLATGYKEIGKVSESIQILEESKTELARGVELLAELYYQSGQTRKAVDLLYERLKYFGRLSEGMAFWLAKGFDTLGNYSEAFEMLEKFVDDPTVKPIYDKAREELGLPPMVGGPAE